MASANMRLVSQSTAVPMLMPMLRALALGVLGGGALALLPLPPPPPPQLAISAKAIALIRANATFLIVLFNVQFGGSFIYLSIRKIGC
jgi:hypothetical protein